MEDDDCSMIDVETEKWKPKEPKYKGQNIRNGGQRNEENVTR